MMTSPTADGKPAGSGIQRVGFLPLLFLFYAYTTAGPFGYEEMFSRSGPGMALLFLILVPLAWSIPMSLTAAELNSLLPVEGGFYRWVRAAFGDFWGFQAGWWNWTGTFLLNSSYGVLFIDYEQLSSVAEEVKDPQRTYVRALAWNTPLAVVSYVLPPALALAALGNSNVVSLVAIYIWTRIATSLLTLLAVWQLRRTQPDAPRTFRIPGRKLGLAYVVTLPAILCGVGYITATRLPITIPPGCSQPGQSRTY